MEKELSIKQVYHREREKIEKTMKAIGYEVGFIDMDLSRGLSDVAETTPRLTIYAKPIKN